MVIFMYNDVLKFTISFLFKNNAIVILNIPPNIYLNKVQSNTFVSFTHPLSIKGLIPQKKTFNAPIK